LIVETIGQLHLFSCTTVHLFDNVGQLNSLLKNTLIEPQPGQTTLS